MPYKETYTHCEMLSDIRDSISRYLATQPCNGPEPPLPCPPSSDMIVFDKPGVYDGCSFQGQIEVTAPDVTFRNMRLEGNNSDYTLLTAHHNTKLENCELIGSPNGQHRGIRVDAGGIRLINTRVKNIWKDIDTQAVGGWNGCKDLVIDGGEYSASGENIMFGGSRCESPDMIPQDILIENAFIYKELEWRKKLRNEVCKNLFELKNAKRVIMRNCRLKHSWGDGQNGEAFVLTVRQQEQSVPFCIIEDVLLENNDIESVGAGFNFLGRDNEWPGHEQPNVLLKNIVSLNNRFKDFDMNAWAGSGRQIMIGAGSKDMQFIGTEFKGTTGGFLTIMSLYEYPYLPYVSEGFVMRDCVVNEGYYAVHGANMSVTGVIEALDIYCPGYVWKDVIVDDAQGGYVYPVQ